LPERIEPAWGFKSQKIPASGYKIQMTSEILCKELKTPGNSWVLKQFDYFIARASIIAPAY